MPTDLSSITMKVELESAVKFIISMLRAGHRAKMVRSKGNKFFLEPEIEMLQMSLFAVMDRQYRNFWFPETPNRGSAYRCIRINKDKMDPIIAKAAASCGLSCNLIRSYLPEELTLWVDPAEVSYRIGEEDGSICVLYEAPLMTIADSRYESSSTSSLASSVSTSPGSSSSSPPFNHSGNHNIYMNQQQQQHLQTVVAASSDGSNIYSNYTTPGKPSNMITFVPTTYGSPVQFVRSPYQSYPTFISS